MNFLYQNLTRISCGDSFPIVNLTSKLVSASEGASGNTDLNLTSARNLRDSSADQVTRAAANKYQS